ncbi:MAG: putative amidoligase domain-containing protein [Promethearchaeota archaeon]
MTLNGIFNEDEFQLNLTTYLEEILFYNLFYDLGDQFKNSDPLESSFNFTIGGDLEVIILDSSGREMIPANQTIFNSTSSTAWFGRDGSGPIAEIRFPYSRNPYTLIINVERSINIFIKSRLFQQKKSSGLIAGFYRFSKPLGGHIHFGISPNDDMIKKLDYYLAIPVLLISDPYELKQRTLYTSYGKLGAFRRKSYGFEYRTLGSFIVDPEIATEIFSLAGIIVEKYRNLPQVEITEQIKNRYNNADKDFFFQKHLPQIKKDLFKLTMKEFSHWPWIISKICQFFRRIDAKEIKISSQKELLHQWSKYTPKKYIFNNDDYLANIKSMILNKIGHQCYLCDDLLIYGAKKSRSSEKYVIFLNRELFRKAKFLLGTEKIKKYHIQEGCFGYGNHHRFSIGLSYDLRKLLAEKPNSPLAKQWLNQICEVIKECAD